MIRFTVVWHPATEEQLTDIWLSSPDRQEVNRAVEVIDRELRINPQEKGAFGDEHSFLLSVPPLNVLYTVSDDDRIAKVMDVFLS